METMIGLYAQTAMSGYYSQTGSLPFSIRWTLEHHKQFLESVVRNGGLNKPQIKQIVSQDIMSRVYGLRSSTIQLHMDYFRQFHQQNESLFKKLPEFDSLVRDFAGLGVEGANNCWSSWTVEHYKEVVEKIIQLGGLGVATPDKVLALMDRRLGLTEEILGHILSRLKMLQERTRIETRLEILNERLTRIQAYGHGGPMRPVILQRLGRNVVHPYSREKIIGDESTTLATIIKSKIDETIMSLRQLVAAHRRERGDIVEYLVTRAEPREEKMENLVTKMDHINLGRSGSASSK
uniref:uncharacterized protein LOC105353050 n=1 Tax=Fragaria vesca subsp. vesca TaxID=101020 RepID=UPI0005CAAECF|nr:PREDICTED: uncharacterized protein LOC105353050 [Fragaria vesca subsp. vesca]